MWIVRNLLRGTLTFRGMNLSVAPKGEVDLDALLGRERAETSNQVLVAFEEGYLQTVRKENAGGGEMGPGVGTVALETRLAAFKDSLSKELGQLRTSLAGDVREILSGLQVARAKLHEEKERVQQDSSLSDAEIRARLAFLDEKENELEKNFREIGKKKSGDTGSGNIAANAELLTKL